jgi:hypothetical protein
LRLHRLEAPKAQANEKIVGLRRRAGVIGSIRQAARC